MCDSEPRLFGVYLATINLATYHNSLFCSLKVKDVLYQPFPLAHATREEVRRELRVVSGVSCIINRFLIDVCSVRCKCLSVFQLTTVLVHENTIQLVPILILQKILNLSMFKEFMHGI